MEFAQKVVSSRRGSLYVSIAAAVLAGIVILAYVNGYRKDLKAGTTPVTVLVARNTIQKGTSGSVIAGKGLFTVTTIRQSQLREGAFSDPSSLTGRVATQSIYKGAQLTAADFSASTDSLASTISDSQRIVSIPLDAAHGLSGDVQEGDHVAVYAGFNVIGIRPDGSPQDGGQSRPVLRLIVPDVEVVRIGSASGIASASRTTAISVRANAQEAAKLTFASEYGKVWLALRPAAGAKAVAPTLVSPETLLLGVRPVTIIHSLGGRR